jgi:diguanylate cyclase (GGDEF)-like protein
MPSGRRRHRVSSALRELFSPGAAVGVGPDSASAGRTADSLLNRLSAADLDFRVQPILLVSAPGRIALELLLRFRPPELARLGTQFVMERAHDLGQAPRVDQLVLERLQEVQRAWLDLGPLAARVQYITVNISGASVATAPRQDALLALLRRHRVDPALFRLELTETDAMELVEGDDSLASAAQRLMEGIGIRLLVDDFGSGLSNYRRLCEAWYDAIKLDLQLVRGIAGSFRRQTFVGSLIAAVHGLGRTVVAEGVEQQADLEVLLRLGADALQGYLIAPPLAWSELPDFLEVSPWLDPACIPAIKARIVEADRQIQAPLAPVLPASMPQPVPLERHILEHWSSLRSFEEVVLLFVQQLRELGLDVLRFSLAFLPDQQEVDCTQYVWYRQRPGEVEGLRMQRDFLQTPQHLESVLHHIATRCPSYRLRLADVPDTGFAFLEELRQLGASEYLGLRLASRGVSIPVLTVCLAGQCTFSRSQLDRIETMSSLLSLLFHAFESERANRIALLDSLTQLPNRRSFDSRIRAEAVAATTAGSPLAVLLIDIDSFKTVNDRRGHAYGDSCLSRVAGVLQQQLQRQNDMVARLGGEEFGVVLAHTDAERARAIADRLRVAVAEEAIEHPAPLNGRGLTISVGLACWDPGCGAPADVDRLLQLADDCLYAAKRKGRNWVVGADLEPPSP